jgi:hypothetical protein
VFLDNLGLFLVGRVFVELNCSWKPAFRALRTFNALRLKRKEGEEKNSRKRKERKQKRKEKEEKKKTLPF